MNFGPLNREGGERRLNVAVTRAREKVVVVGSLRAADLDLGATRAVGVTHLHAYLDYAERGTAALQATTPAGEEAEPSALEREVLAEVRRLGYEAVPRVGCGEYRVDLGVVAPGTPGRFLLGIECDGPTYQAAATARDRDRLRQEVLAQLGWKLHRIWAPAWLNRREEEVQRLRQALEEAARTKQPEDPAAPPRPVPVPAPATNNDKAVVKALPTKEAKKNAKRR
jgi:very-short-patch-repair endonuclease